MTEAEFQAQVIQLCEMRGFTVGHFADSRKQAGGRLVGDTRAKGIPDLVIVGRRCLWAELKAEHGRLSTRQRFWLDGLSGAGVETYLWTPGDFSEIQRVLGLWRWLPRGERSTELGRLADDPCLADVDGARLWQPGSLWVAGHGRADERRVVAA